MLKSYVFKILILGCFLSRTLAQDAFQVKKKYFYRNQRQQLSTTSQNKFKGYQESGVAPNIPFNLPNEIKNPSNLYGVPSPYLTEPSINSAVYSSNDYNKKSPFATIYGIPEYQNEYQAVNNLAPYQPQSQSTNVVFMKKIPLYKMHLQPSIQMYGQSDVFGKDFNNMELPNNIKEDELDDLNSTNENETVLISVDEDGNVIDLPVETDNIYKSTPVAYIPKRHTSGKIRLNGLDLIYVKRFK